MQLNAERCTRSGRTMQDPHVVHFELARKCSSSFLSSASNRQCLEVGRPTTMTGLNHLRQEVFKYLPFLSMKLLYTTRTRTINSPRRVYQGVHQAKRFLIRYCWLIKCPNPEEPATIWRNDHRLFSCHESNVSQARR